MAPYTLRQATIADAPAIADLTIELGYEATATEVAGQLAILLPRQSHFVAVAEVDERVVGWIAAEQRIFLGLEPRVEIVGLVVAKGSRRSGIARALVTAAERWATEQTLADRPARTIFVRSNVTRAESHLFYESVEYKRHKTQHAYIKRFGS